VIEEKELVKALQAGRLGGAGLDVFSKEPLHNDHPLLTLQKVVLTPHVAGGRPNPHSDEWFARMSFCVRNIDKALSGQTPENAVQTS